MLRPRANTFFRPNPSVELTLGPLSGELNTFNPDIDIEPDQLSGGQNMTRARASDSSIKKRGGIQLFGPFLGTSTGILGGYNAISASGVQDVFVAHGTNLYSLTSSAATALTGVTLTSNLPGNFVYFAPTNKTYYVNGTDNVVKIAPGGSSGDQTDATFKKGKYLAVFKNILLVAGVSGLENYVFYADIGSDTFTGVTWGAFYIDEPVTGLIGLQDKLLIFSKRRLHRLMNFTFTNGTFGGVTDSLPITFGSIAHRTVTFVNNYVYFLGQDTTNKASIYFTDGYQVRSLSDTKISSTLNNLNPAVLTNACAVGDGFNYRLQVADSGKTLNNIGILYDTVRGFFYPIENRFLESRAEISVMWSSESAGVWNVYGGTQGTGQVYELNANDGLYDELGEERYLVNGSYNVPIDANPARRAGQSFKMTQYQSSQSVNVTQVAVLLKKNTGTTTQLTVRLETDNNGTPSGTLVSSNATGTIPAITNTSYAWYNSVFTSPVTLIGNTKYWLVLKHTTEGTGSSQCYWLGDSCTATYTPGNLATYAGGVGGPITTTDNPNAATDSPKTAIDGYAQCAVVGGDTSTWANLYSGSGGRTTAFDSASGIQVSIYADTLSNNWSVINRGITLFDTSALPDDATITSATLSLYVTGVRNELNQSLGIVTAAPASNTSFVANDYLPANFGSTRLATDVNLASLSLNTYVDFALNATGIAAITATGVSKFGLRLSADIDNSPPTWAANNASNMICNSADNTGNKPRLTITYTTGSGQAAWHADPITDQVFVVYAESPIDAYADSKAFLLAEGREAQVERFFTIFNTAAQYNVEVSFASATFAGVTPFQVSLTAVPGAKWGDGIAKWGDGTSIWGGGQTRNYQWTEINYFVSRVVKMRVRNRQANQQFEFNRAVFEVSPRETQT